MVSGLYHLSRQIWWNNFNIYAYNSLIAFRLNTSTCNVVLNQFNKSKLSHIQLLCGEIKGLRHEYITDILVIHWIQRVGLNGG